MNIHGFLGKRKLKILRRAQENMSKNGIFGANKFVSFWGFAHPEFWSRAVYHSFDPNPGLGIL
jgi:hypothetical protein